MVGSSSTQGMGERLRLMAADPYSGMCVDYTGPVDAVRPKTPDMTSGVFNTKADLLIFEGLVHDLSDHEVATRGMAAILHFPRHRLKRDG